MSQDRGTRRNLNARKVALTLTEIERIVWGDRKKGIPAQELSHKERLGYLAAYAKIAKTLSDWDKSLEAEKKRGAFS